MDIANISNAVIPMYWYVFFIPVIETIKLNIIGPIVQTVLIDML